MRDVDGAVDREGSGGVVDNVERASVELEVVPPDLDGIDIVAECPPQVVISDETEARTSAGSGA